MLSSQTLTNQLVNIPNSNTEQEAIQNLASAWISYFQEATTAGVQINAASLSTAKTAMIGAMTGLSTTGAVSLQSGIVAFWGSLVPLAATLFIVPPNVTTTIIPPTTISTIAASLLPIFAANVSSAASKQDACSSIATTIHLLNLGGIVTLTPPTGTPIPSPIL